MRALACVLLLLAAPVAARRHGTPHDHFEHQAKLIEKGIRRLASERDACYAALADGTRDTGGHSRVRRGKRPGPAGYEAAGRPPALTSMTTRHTTRAEEGGRHGNATPRGPNGNK